MLPVNVPGCQDVVTWLWAIGSLLRLMTSKKPYAQKLPCLKFVLAALVETRLPFASGNRKEGETVHCRVQD